MGQGRHTLRSVSDPVCPIVRLGWTWLVPPLWNRLKSRDNEGTVASNVGCNKLLYTQLQGDQC